MLQLELSQSGWQSPPHLRPAMRKNIDGRHASIQSYFKFQEPLLSHPHLPAGMVKQAAKCRRSGRAEGAAAVRCEPLQPRLGEPSMFNNLG